MSADGAEVRILEVPFTTRTRCRLLPPRRPGPGKPPLFVCLHGQGQSGARQQRWMGPAVPAHFAAAFPDGFLAYEIRQPERPIRIGHGWYLFDGDRSALIESLEHTDRALWTLIDAAVDALDADPRRIWMAGFSQGAYLTHVTALKHLDRVAGWIGQAGGFRAEYVGGSVADLTGKAVLMQHGRDDASLPLERSKQTADLFASRGATITLSVHDAGHVITEAMAREAHDWLAAREPARG